MLEPGEDPKRVAVWLSMAEHFLDTETRHDIPLTALRCTEAGISVEEAHFVWCYEVAPVVGPNLLSVAGEWAGWDDEWLLSSIRSVRKRPWNRPGFFQRLLQPLRAPLNRGTWRAVENCMRVLLQNEAPSREQLARDLSALARHWFDFCPDDTETIDAPTLERRQALYPEPFRSLIEPVTLRDELEAAEERLRSALANRTG